MISTSPLRTEYRQRKALKLASLSHKNASIRGVQKSLQGMAKLVDKVLNSLWAQLALPPHLALVAVGGFGRGELMPHSDVDVLILLPDGLDLASEPALQKNIETFIGQCWDVGLEIGSSVRTVSECLEESEKDVTVQTALLEARLLCGSEALFQNFQSRYQAAMDPAAFFTAKSLELRHRHNKYENTPYALEPNCKESPGGLRDLQTVLWVAKAAGMGNSWEDLAANGLVTELEVKNLQRNQAWLNLVRAKLHLAAGRREDRLIFDLQTTVAESLGFENKPKSNKPDEKVFIRASEQLMKRYYWGAKAVTQLQQILMLNIEERLHPKEHQLSPINERFFNKAGMIEVASDDLYLREPHAILETFLVYQQTVGVKGLSARTLRALYNARKVMDAKFRADPINRDTFLQILQQPEGITHAMRLMNQTSVLGRYLWVFRRIVGQMQHDLFHVYTVDQHILMVLRNVRRFFMPEHAHEYPFCSQLASGFEKPWLLYAGALFHDIAKGRGGDHSQLGHMETMRFARQHHLNKADAEFIAFLVNEHLTMSHVAQKQDLGDPDVIEAFAKRVGNERRLTGLYLLTVADIRGTSPKVWNAWKGKLLEDLYRSTLRALGGHASEPQAVVESRKREAMAKLALAALPHQAQKPLWDRLDVSYFMRHDAEDIAWHTRMLSRYVDSSEPIVKARLSPWGDGLQVVVYTPDQSDLFARICGYFDQSGFSILDAKVHTTSAGYALDTFQIVTEMLPEHYQEFTQKVEVELAQTLKAESPLPAPGRARLSRRVKSFPIAPRVSLSPDEKAQRWLLSISASDRLGLLYTVARILSKHHISLQLAKVTTLGERVEDTFVVEGQGLQNNKKQIEIETELLSALAN
jgi:[protein-PII] uridylyltransferase